MAKTLLLDNSKGNNSFLCALFDKTIISPETCCLPLTWVLGALKALWNTSRNDTIVVWYDFQAVMLFWMARICLTKRNIVCLNILLKPKSSLKNRIVTQLYRTALESDCFKATVTSSEYGRILNDHLGEEFDYMLLHDVYHDNYDAHYSGEIKKNSVFCGGHNGRDWDFMMNLTMSLPDIKFNIVAPESVYNKYADKIGKNVNLQTNLSFEAFTTLLCKSQIVSLPLDTEAPAGLIVMFQSAANMRPIITTKTVTTSEYVTEDRGVSLPNDAEMWANTIREALENPAPFMKKAQAMKAFLQAECSENIFLDTLDNIINNF